MIYRRKKDGRYAVRVDLKQRGANGKRIRRSVGTYRTLNAAKAAERKALDDIEKGIDPKPPKKPREAIETVDDLIDGYLAECESNGCTTKTSEIYSGLARRYIRPHLGTVAIDDLRPADVAAWRDLLLQRGGEDGAPLSACTVAETMTLLSGAYKHALAMDVAHVSPCIGVKRPRIRRFEGTALSAEEIARLLNIARATRWEAFVGLALATGARRGELLALSWSDYDEAQGTLTIRHSLGETVSDGVKLGDTKTHEPRTILLSPVAQNALRVQRLMQAKDRLLAGTAYDHGDVIFADELGHRIRPVLATKAYADLARKANLPTTRLHDLRGTAATTMLALGADLNTVAKILGHTSATMTLQRYGHLLHAVQRDAADRLSSYLEGLQKGAS